MQCFRLRHITFLLALFGSHELIQLCTFASQIPIQVFIKCSCEMVGAKRVYVTGQVVYAIGMLMMAVSRDKVAAILLSPTAGVMYATLFTMPYLLVAHYHSSGLVSVIIFC